MTMRKKQISEKCNNNFENDILVASRNIAKRYSSGKNHIVGTTDVALDIFDSTRKIHGMGKRERLLLQIAVLLHDCGKYISMSEVAECSYRIIMATEIIGLSTEERQVIASAVRYNTREFGCYEEINRGNIHEQGKLSPDCEADRDSPPGQCYGQKPLPEGKSA